MLGARFSKFTPKDDQNLFERLFSIFKELLVYTSGDVPEALDWMNQLDREYKLTDENYGMGDFIEDLKRLGYIQDNEDGEVFAITSKMEQSIRKDSLDQVFGKLKKKQAGKPQNQFYRQGR